EPTSKKRHTSELYRNNGDGTFTEISRDAGIVVTGVVKAVAAGDFDNDGRTDLYCSRFGEPNLLFRNAEPAADGGVRFVDVTTRAGVAEPQNSFPTWFFDYDNDGWLDLLVAGFAGFDGDSLDDVAADYVGIANNGTRCRLYRNRGDGTFDDVSERVGINRVILAMGANFGDIDNDGWLDCAFGTGEPTLSTLVPNRLFRNAGGQRFQDVTTAAGFGNIQKGHGIAFGDIDGDGDQDIAMTLGGAFEGDIYPNLLLRNPGHGNHWLTVRCEGVMSNRSAIGARIELTVSTPAGTLTLHRVVGTGGSFGSSTVQQEIGLGDAIEIEALRLHWPTSDTTTIITGVPLDAIIIVREDEPTFERIMPIDAPLPEPGGAPAHPHDHAGHDHHSMP
ncbi:MAG: CRTAC1 family protein, partial [Phycisphaerales bacterium]|nr:CRTAC1 family protein [Phycisphaerales bacterium]